MGVKGDVEKQRPLKFMSNDNFQRSFVELEGFEPSSRQAAKPLSTCLVYG